MPPLQQVVADNLRQVRHDQGLSQSELAFRAGIDRGFLSMLENGTLSVTVTVLDKLAHALRVEPAALLNSDLHRSISRNVYRRIRVHRAIDIGIGRRIRYIRKLHGLSRKMLAMRLGLTIGRLRKYERGVRRVRPELLVGVAAILNARIGAFFTDHWAAKSVDAATYSPRCRYQDDRIFEDDSDLEAR